MNLISESMVKAIEELYYERIEACKINALDNLQGQDYIHVQDQVVNMAIGKLLGYHIWRLCYKTFIYEFHQYRTERGLPVDSESSEAFDAYVGGLDRKTIKSWMDKYSQLKIMIDTVVNNTCDYMIELAKHFRQDVLQLINLKMLDEGDCLVEMLSLDSDPHNGSKIAFQFIFDSKQKLVYKPRSLDLDVSMNQIFIEGFEIESLGIQSPIAQTLSLDDHGWQIFITHTPVSEDTASLAIKRLGICSALFTSIGASDLHDENIIIHEANPYFIDLETSLKPGNTTDFKSLQGVMANVLHSSVIATSILPSKIPSYPHNTLIGAINTRYPQKTKEKVFSIKNPGTDAIDIAKMDVEITRPSTPLRLKNDEMLDSVPYQNDFVEGYVLGYRHIMKRKDLISEKLEKLNSKMRLIVRPTSQYAYLLDACLFPEYLIDDASIEKVLSYLKPNRFIKDEQINQEILKQEKASLKVGDIPYISMKSKNTQFQIGDYHSPIAFDHSAVENGLRILHEMNEKKLNYDLRLISEGFCEIKVHQAQYNQSGHLGYESNHIKEIFNSVTVENPYPMIDFVYNQAIATSGELTKVGWLPGLYGNCGYSYDSRFLVSMHDAGGIQILFEHLDDDMKYRTLHHLANKGLDSNVEHVGVYLAKTKSVISGLSSIDYLQNHMQKQLTKTEKMVRTFLEEQVPSGDIYLGALGHALVLSTFEDTSTDVMEILNHYVIHRDDLKDKKPGVAHGELGALWSEFRIAYKLGDYKKCHEVYDQVKGKDYELTGWCNGSSGLLMVLSEMQSKLAIKNDLYKLALKAATTNPSKAIDISVCHGCSGVLQSLLFTYRCTKDLKYLSLAKRFFEETLEIGKKKGFMTGEENRDYLLGYFLGWSGFADSAVLLNQYTHGNSSWIPLNLSSSSYQENIDWRE